MDQTGRTCSGAPLTTSTRFARGEAGRPTGRAADQFDLVINLTTARALGLTIPGVVSAARRRSDRMKEDLSACGTMLPCRLPLVRVRKLGSSCQWCARGTDLKQSKVDRPSATRQSTGEDDNRLVAGKPTI